MYRGLRVRIDMNSMAFAGRLVCLGFSILVTALVWFEGINYDLALLVLVGLALVLLLDWWGWIDGQ